MLENPKTRARSWNVYNTSLKQRGSLYLYFQPDFLQKSWYFSNNRKPGGKIIYSEKLIEMMLTIRFVFNLPFRQLEGFVESILAAMSLKADVPNYTTICRRSKFLSQKKLKYYAAFSRDKELHLLLDASGLSVFSASPNHACRYPKDRLAKKGGAWKKFHIAFDLESAQIIGSELTDSRISDFRKVPDLLAQSPGKVGSIRADRAYSVTSLYRELEGLGIAPIIPTKCDAQPQHKGDVAESRNAIIRFVRSHKNYEEGIKAWKIGANYHQRSLVETQFHRFKKSFGYHFKSKCFENQETEVKTKLNILNLWSHCSQKREM